MVPEFTFLFRLNNFLSDQAECPTDKGLGLKRRRYFVLNLHFARHKTNLSLKRHGLKIAYNIPI